MGDCGKTEREAALTSYHEYRLLVEGHTRRHQEKMEIARWVCFHIYSQNPYIKPPRAKTLESYVRFDWEKPMKEEAERMAESCAVSPEVAAQLNQIFENMRKNEDK